MKKFKPFLIPILILVAFLTMSHIVRSTGSPGGKTGSPGDGSNTCTQCHGGGKATDIAGWITSDIPEAGYRPGNQYTITVKGQRTGAAAYGFELTAEKSNRAKTGGFATGGSNQVQLLSGGNAVTQTNQGLTPSGGQKSWSVQWTAPAKGTGDVTFYAAVNTANGDGSTTGDVIYATNYKVKEQDLSSTEPVETFASVRIYPNPASDLVRLETSGMDSGEIQIELMSINGQRVLSQVHSLESGSGYVTLKVDRLPSGTYFATVQSGAKKASTRLIISR